MDRCFTSGSKIGNFVSQKSCIFDHVFQEQKFFHDLVIGSIIDWGGTFYFERRREISSLRIGFLFRFGGIEMTDSLQCIHRETIHVSACQKFLEKFTFKFMSELFESIFADLEFTKSDKVKIKDIILFFEFHQCSEKFYNSSKCIGSSRHFQDFIIKTLYTEAIS